MQLADRAPKTDKNVTMRIVFRSFFFRIYNIKDIHTLEIKSFLYFGNDQYMATFFYHTFHRS